MSREAQDLLSGQLGYFTFFFLFKFLYKTVQNRDLKLYVLGNLGTKISVFSLFLHDDSKIK